MISGTPMSRDFIEGESTPERVLRVPAVDQCLLGAPPLPEANGVRREEGPRFDGWIGLQHGQ